MDLGPTEAHLVFNGRNTPFVNHTKYFGVIFGRTILWRLYTKIIEATAFGTLIRMYFLFKRRRLSSKIKLILYIELIK
jgi:hypothetical protein